MNIDWDIIQAIAYQYNRVDGCHYIATGTSEKGPATYIKIWKATGESICRIFNTHAQSTASEISDDITEEMIQELPENTSTQQCKLSLAILLTLLVGVAGIMTLAVFPVCHLHGRYAYAHYV